MEKRLYDLLETTAERHYSLELSQDEWFQIFLAGKFCEKPLLYIQPQNDQFKRVTFQENEIGP